MPLRCNTAGSRFPPSAHYNGRMRYRLRTLLMVMGVLPLLIGCVAWTVQDEVFRSTMIRQAASALDDAPAVGKAAVALAIFVAVVVPFACLACLIAGAFVKSR